MSADQAADPLGEAPPATSDAGPARRPLPGAEGSNIPDAPETPESAVETEQDPTDPADKSGREAAKYRRQLREVEAERDQLRATVESLQRAEAQRLAATELAQPAALWAAGVQLGDLIDPDGQIDPAKVAQAVTTARQTLGLAAPLQQPQPDPGQGITQPPAAGQDTGWKSILSGSN